MSLKNRYLFFKRMYPSTLIIFENKKKQLTTMSLDFLMFKQFDKNLRLIKNKNIDYMLIDNLTIIEKSFYLNNEYDKYYKISLIKRILDKNIIFNFKGR